MSQPGGGGEGGRQEDLGATTDAQQKGSSTNTSNRSSKKDKKIKSSFCPVISNATFAHLSHFGFQIEVTKNRWDNARQIIQNTKQN